MVRVARPLLPMSILAMACWLIWPAESVRSQDAVWKPMLGANVRCKDEELGSDYELRLESELGAGKWGSVFRAGSLAVKVEKDASWRKSDRWANLKDYRHECGIMRSLEGQQGMNLPRCLAYCDIDGHSVMVMDLVTDAKDLTKAQAMSSAAQARMALDVYRSATAMLSAGISNVDQRAVNILAKSSGQAFLIDMGMASRDSEIREMCAAADQGFPPVRKMKPLVGLETACNSHISHMHTSFLMSAFLSLETGGASLTSLVDAFCASPHRELVHTQLVTVSMGDSDRAVRKAFTEEPMWFQRGQGDRWVKSTDAEIKGVLDERGRKHSWTIPAGATLAAVKCADEYKPEDIRFWVPGYKGQDVCPGTYIFVRENVTTVATVIVELLERSKVWDLVKRVKQCA